MTADTFQAAKAGTVIADPHGGYAVLTEDFCPTGTPALRIPAEVTLDAWRVRRWVPVECAHTREYLLAKAREAVRLLEGE